MPVGLTAERNNRKVLGLQASKTQVAFSVYMYYYDSIYMYYYYYYTYY